MSTLTLVLTAVGSVLLLLFLVMKARMHAFVALMVVSIGAGLFSGMPLDKIAATMEKGMGGTLGFLAIVVALGAMFGKILHETGRSIRLPSRCSNPSATIARTMRLVSRPHLRAAAVFSKWRSYY